MICRPRYYWSYEEAVQEWRRFRVPDPVPNAVDLLGTIVVYVEDASEPDLEYLEEAVDDLGGKAFRCDGSVTRLLIAGTSDMYWDLSNSDLGQQVYQSISNSIAVPESIDLTSGRLKFNRTLIMGVLNITPDSFFDGGRYLQKEDAVKRALEMVDEGADVIDIGGESTRPNAEPVSKEEELQRVIPIIKDIAPSIEVPISIDTMKAEVARQAVEGGAQIINDVSGLRDDDMIRASVDASSPVVLMHMKGEPRTMQMNTYYEDVVGDIAFFLQERMDRAKSLGLAKERIIIDPGVGFGKRIEDNLAIVRRLREFKSLGRPVLIGPSRKGFIGKILNRAEEERLEGTMAVVAASILQGANMVRVHDVKETIMTVKLMDSIASLRDGLPQRSHDPDHREDSHH